MEDDKYNSVRIAKDVSGAASWWWLRSPDDNSSGTASVNGVSFNGVGVDDGSGGVRPALWLNL